MPHQPDQVPSGSGYAIGKSGRRGHPAFQESAQRQGNLHLVTRLEGAGHLCCLWPALYKRTEPDKLAVSDKYTTPGGKVKVEIFLRDKNIWLTQEKIGFLFGVQRPAITKHLKNIFESGGLTEDSVSSILEHTALPEISN